MASTAKEYLNSDGEQSGKNHAIAPFRLVELIRYSGAPRHLRATLLAMLKAAGNVGIVLWPAIKGIMIEGGVCRRTVQRNLKRLADQELLIRVHPANEWLSEKHFRHTATYRLNVPRLRALRRPKEIHSSEWRTYLEYKNATRSSHRSRRPSPPAQEAAASPMQPATTAASVHAAPPEKKPHVVGLTPRRQEKLARMVASLKGRTLDPPKNKAEQRSEDNRRATEEAKRWIELKYGEADPWERMLNRIKHRLNRHSYDIWLQPTHYSHENDGVLFVRVPTKDFFIIGPKYEKLFAETIQELRLPYTGIQFVASDIPDAEDLMGDAEALQEACRNLGISLEAGREHLLRCGWKFDARGDVIEQLIESVDRILQPNAHSSAAVLDIDRMPPPAGEACDDDEG